MDAETSSAWRERAVAILDAKGSAAFLFAQSKKNAVPLSGVMLYGLRA